MKSFRTLGELRQSPFTEPRLASRRVKDELRENLMSRPVSYTHLDVYKRQGYLSRYTRMLMAAYWVAHPAMVRLWNTS